MPLKTTPLIINSDVDGVVYDYSGQLYKMGYDYFGRKTPWPEPEGWDTHVTMGIEEEEFWSFFHSCVSQGVFRRGEPIPGAGDAIQQWVKEGHRVRLVTNKHLRYPNSTLYAQIDMLHFLHSRDLINDVEIVFAMGKYKKQGYPADVVIDDKPTLEWAQEGALNILFHQPCNKNVEVPDGIIRVDGWNKVLEVVRDFAEERSEGNETAVL